MSQRIISRKAWHEIKPALPRRNACRILDIDPEYWAQPAHKHASGQRIKVQAYKYGVYQEPHCINSYYYTFRHAGKRYHAGGFPTAEDAAVAYDRACIALNIRENKLNFPEEQ